MLKRKYIRLYIYNLHMYKKCAQRLQLSAQLHAAIIEKRLYYIFNSFASECLSALIILIKIELFQLKMIQVFAFSKKKRRN
jgi:hypothetical protein